MRIIAFGDEKTIQSDEIRAGKEIMDNGKTSRNDYCGLDLISAGLIGFTLGLLALILYIDYFVL